VFRIDVSRLVVGAVIWVVGITERLKSTVILHAFALRNAVSGYLDARRDPVAVERAAGLGNRACIERETVVAKARLGRYAPNQRM